MSIVFRAEKGSQLTSAEVDGNFQYLLNKFGEGLVSVGNYEVDGFNVSLSGSDWVWRIFDNEYILNPFGFNHTAVPTTSGNVRVEIICGYEDGSIVVLQGPAGAVEVDPPIPNNYVSLLRYVVGNNSITVTNPIAGDSYIRKDSDAFTQIVPTVAEFNLNIDNYRNFVINSNLPQTTIVRVVKTTGNISTSTDTNWSGSDLCIYRKIGSSPLKIKHHIVPATPAQAEGGTFYFPNGEDYDVEEGEMLKFKLMQPGTLITTSPVWPFNMGFPIYLFAGSSKGGGGGDSVFEGPVTFVLEPGDRFGRYKNGDTANWTGLTSKEAILDAAIAFLQPTAPSLGTPTFGKSFAGLSSGWNVENGEAITSVTSTVTLNSNGSAGTPTSSGIHRNGVPYTSGSTISPSITGTTSAGLRTFRAFKNYSESQVNPNPVLSSNSIMTFINPSFFGAGNSTDIESATTVAEFMSTITVSPNTGGKKVLNASIGAFNGRNLTNTVAGNQAYLLTTGTLTSLSQGGAPQSFELVKTFNLVLIDGVTTVSYKLYKLAAPLGAGTYLNYQFS